MFTFTINNGKIFKADGAPDYIFSADDYEKFKANLLSFEAQFSPAIFGCVESTDLNYDLSEDRKVPLASGDNTNVGVYFGICKEH